MRYRIVFYQRISAVLIGCCALLPVRADEVARELLQHCLPAPVAISLQAGIDVEVTYKNKAPEAYHYLRLEDPQRIYIDPDGGQGPALLLDKPNAQAWRYATDTGRFSAAGESNTPLWLLSETFMQPRRLDAFEVAISSHNSFGGMDYYTLNATRADAPYPKRSLSFKRAADGRCHLMRAAYFNNDNKLDKKLFFQWRVIEGHTLLKALHLEDVSTLTAVRYHIDAVDVVDAIAPGRFPTPPGLETPGME
ncbi:hypothetical protein Tel_00955 [Candidatus Tenderia electrophaga]|uniref:Outer membrane lipoprotein-sorting protein n=1 Tax=Candidatus Tenderia electrophaga TaxID=1748243 RepID=A0A0S2T9H5_9GAMM|nr:hypothetical protein Tel_00955 [Candidatus Tenderia electrophaga]